MQKQIHIHLNQGKQHTLSDLTCHICCKEDKVPTPGPGWGMGGGQNQFNILPARNLQT